MDENDFLLLAEVKLGEEARDFIESDLGRYLLGRAQQQIDEAKDGLLSCNLRTFWGKRRASLLQRDAKVAMFFVEWLVDAINNGEAAAAVAEST